MERRSFLIGLGGLLAAPAVVRASSIMQVRTPIWSPADLFADGTTGEWFDGTTLRRYGGYNVIMFGKQLTDRENMAVADWFTARLS